MGTIAHLRPLGISADALGLAGATGAAALREGSELASGDLEGCGLPGGVCFAGHVVAALPVVHQYNSALN